MKELKEGEVFQEALKYYANILTPFSRFVKQKIDQLKELNLPIEIIAPSHGVIWRKDPMRIVEKYYEWAAGIQEKSVVVIYNSMWGATHKMAEFIGKGLGEVGVPYKIFEISTADKNDVITEIFKSKGILLGSSTVNNGILSSLTPLLEDLVGLKFTNKFGAAFGSYGWSGESTKILEEHLAKAKVKVIQEPIRVKYMPDEKELEDCIEFGRKFGEKLVEE